jgi:phytoene dehydrogenase-like protein
METEKHFESIVIGAGLSGLCAANKLASRGCRTLLIDKNNQPGGVVMNFSRKGFRFDVSTHFINGCGPGGMVNRILSDFGAQDLVQWLPIKNLLNWIDTGNRYEAKPPVDLENYLIFLIQEFPHQARQIRKYFRRFSGILPIMFDLMLAPGLLNQVRNVFRVIPTLALVTPTILSSGEKILKKYFQDPALIELLYYLYTGFGIDKSLASHFIWTFSEFSYRQEGAWYPRGGGGTFTAALGRHFEDNGGRLLLRHEVTSIEVKSRRARSVTCRDSRGNEKTFTADVIINTGDVCTLATRLVPPGTFSKKWIRKQTGKETMRSMFNVYAALDIDLKDHGFDSCSVWRLNGEYQTPEHYEKVNSRLDFSQPPMDIVYLYSNGPDDTAFPPGKTVLSYYLVCKIDPWYGLLENGKKGQRYKEQKEKCGRQIIDRMADLFRIPDLKDHLEAVEIATPLTLQRYNLARNGSPMGFAFSVENMKSTVFWTTPVKNLYTAGQFTFPGGGMSPAIMNGWFVGKMAARRIEKLRTHNEVG